MRRAAESSAIAHTCDTAASRKLVAWTTAVTCQLAVFGVAAQRLALALLLAVSLSGASKGCHVAHPGLLLRWASCS